MFEPAFHIDLSRFRKRFIQLVHGDGVGLGVVHIHLPIFIDGHEPLVRFLVGGEGRNSVGAGGIWCTENKKSYLKIIFNDPCKAAYVPVDDKVAPNLNHFVGEDLFAGVQLAIVVFIRERIDPEVNELVSVTNSVRNWWFGYGKKDVEH